MNILITGATGFIGRHLANALSKSEHSVRCLVRKTSNLDFLRNINVEIYYGDLLEKDSIRQALEKVDVIYHLAGQVHSRHKDDYHKGNISTTRNLLDGCREQGLKKIIFLSSVGVYRPVVTKALLTEESDCEPITFYGKTKLDAEELIKKYNIPWVIVRAPVVYGPYQPPVLNRFFLDVFNKKKMYIVGSGDNLRSLCFIDNLVEGLILLSNKPVDGKTYILSDSQPYTLNEIIEVGSKVIKQRVEVVHLPNFLGNIAWKIYRLMDGMFDLCLVELYAIKKMQLHEGCDITKARKEIGYNPSITLEAGIESTIGWIKKNYING
jgi:nucleoside-diphosphate-sugar epimerase